MTASKTPTDTPDTISSSLIYPTHARLPSSWCVLHNWALLSLEGEKCQDFLQGQTTCDLKKLSGTHALWGAHCNVKGRALANFLIFEHQKQLLILGHKSLLPALGQSLEKYGIFNRLKARQQSLILAGCFTPAQAALAKAPFAVKHEAGVTHISITPGMSVQVAEELQPLEAIHQERAASSEFEWTQGLIDAGMAWLCSPLGEQFLPNELNMDYDGGIAFDKGCYLGQEVIARLHYKSSPKQRVSKLLLPAGTSQLNPGDRLRNSNGEGVGTILLSAQTTTGEGRVLAMLRLKLAPLFDNSLTELELTTDTGTQILTHAQSIYTEDH